MTLPARFSLAVSLGLSLLPTAYGGASEPPERPVSHRSVEPATLSIHLSNQEMAESIAAQLRQSGVLQQYDVDIRFREGAAELTGSVTDAGQHDRVLRLVQSVPGVQRVIDHLSVAGSIVPVQAGGVPEALPPVPGSNPVPPAPPPAAAPGAAAPGAPPPEATPIFQAPGPAPHQLNPPRMPPYAWPTYAPYNNYSRVGYPLAYPYNSFPFIGPVYPFPKVPLGWRSVRLEWDDGFW
ncbi:MAG: BON domain-containing protein, partial [Gemmataceae bacterium]